MIVIFSVLSATGKTRTPSLLRFESVAIVNEASPAVVNGSANGVPENFHVIRRPSDNATAVLGRIAPWQVGQKPFGLPSNAAQHWRWIAPPGTPHGQAWSSLNMVPEAAGTTYTIPLADGSVRYPTSYHGACAQTRDWRGDARWHVPNLRAPMTADGWASIGAIEFSLSPNGTLLQTVDELAAWSWTGVEAAGGMDVEASRKFFAPRVYTALPLPESAGGGYLAVVAAFLQGNETKGFSGHLSLLAFRSEDALRWTYTATIVRGDNHAQKLGPTEPDLAVLADGTSIMCVIRLDGDGACGSDSYRYYHQTYSRDGGRTWTTPSPINGTGCARPRLLKLSHGGPLLLSGGRLCVEDTKDISLWVNRDGMAGVHGGPSRQQWQRYSLSYWHNALWKGDPAYRFTAKVNDTTAAESLSYTSILETSPRSVLVMYNKYLSRGFSQCVNFAMRITIMDDV